MKTMVNKTNCFIRALQVCLDLFLYYIQNSGQIPFIETNQLVKQKGSGFRMVLSDGHCRYKMNKRRKTRFQNADPIC